MLSIVNHTAGRPAGLEFDAMQKLTRSCNKLQKFQRMQGESVGSATSFIWAWICRARRET
jgi:hypothetical protein